MIITEGSTVFDENGNKLEVGEYIGRGGFGVVYKIVNFLGQTSLAIKTLDVAFPSASDMASFINEGNLAKGLIHQNVIDYKFFHDGSQYSKLPPYIIMEYADGGTMGEMLGTAKLNKQFFSKDVLTDVMLQLVDGLDAINKTLVHRDIKPANILVSGGVFKISDFGLAKLAWEATRTMTFKGYGTFPYMAPEAWKREENTIKLDIYAMGMVFYELATLQHPFAIRSTDPREWMDAHLLEAVVPPNKLNSNITPGMSQMIMKMIEKSAANRAGSWQVVRNLLAVDNEANLPSGSLVANMLQKRIEADSDAESKRLQKEKDRQTESSFGKLVVSQAKESIIVPLQELFDQFNAQYASGKIKSVLQPSDYSLAYSIVMPNGISGKVEFKALIESEFWREQQFNDFGRIFTRRVLAVPQIDNRKVQGFGIVQLSDGRGFNVALVERAGDLYGEWFMLINKNGVFLDRRARPEPFAFAYSEMEKELPLIRAMHIYSTELRALEHCSVEFA